MRILVVAASLRKDSFNRRLAELAIKPLEAAGHEVVRANYADWDVVGFNQDLEAEQRPVSIDGVKAQIESAQAMMIVTPEYNFSFPGTLKNAIDWLSRFRPVPLSNKPMMLLSASPGLVGGNRSLWALRVPLESLGAFVHPTHFSLAQANQAFADDGSLKDAALGARLESSVLEFARWSAKLLG